MTPARAASSSMWVQAAIAATLIAPFLIYYGTAQSIVSIWNSSETFAHGYIILPISLWLIWQRRASLVRMTPAPYWPALLLLAVCGFGWLLAELGSVQVVRQYAFVAMLPLAVLALLGLQITWSIAFPLLFLLLAVPFGDAFIEPLIGFTADFTVAAIQMSGIPVLREGNHFSIPSGNWSVVEACSGVRYLIASVTLGALYAYLTYRSRIRQAVFVLLSILVPIIANGIRAYLIVMIGHFSGMKLAVGVDHLIYGWLFFGFVMFLMFWIGSIWREDRHEPIAEKMGNNLEISAPPTSPLRIAAASLAIVASLAVWPIYANYLDRAGFNPAPAELAGFRPQWQEATPFTTWKPGFFPASAGLNRFFQRDAQQVGIHVLYYRNQNKESMLISSMNQLVTENDTEWRRTGSSVRQETVAGRLLSIRETRIQGVSGSLLVWHWYWIGGEFTASDYFGKLLQAKEKLLMRGDDGAAMMVFSPYAENPDEARAALRNFLTDNLAPLESTLAGNK